MRPRLKITLKPNEIVYIGGYPFTISQRIVEPNDFLLDRRDGISAQCLFVELNGTLAIKKGDGQEYGVPVNSVYRLTPFVAEQN